MKTIPTKPRRILVTCPQRLGDVLLTTALVHTLKQAWPAAHIDMLVFRGTEGVLAGNPDIHQVIAQAPRVGLGQRLKEITQLWRRYDLAVAAMPTDRSRLAAWIGGRFRVGFLTEREAQKAWLLNKHVRFDDLDTHTITMQAELARTLGIKPLGQVIPPQLSPVQHLMLSQRLAALQRPIVVLHPCPKFR
ncbi:MAG TPA: hypothetical protein VL381_01425, partial [Rhodocyclaceae bacterium]|nr:hypothetical protein [Rhodocyclaceae bacterium]